MTNNEITKALLEYRLLEDQKAIMEAQQTALKLKIEAHMLAAGVEQVEANGVVASFVPRTKYSFDVQGILTAVPAAIKVLKLSNESYEKLLKGNEQLIGTMRKVLSNDKSLTIRAKKEAAE